MQRIKIAVLGCGSRGAGVVAYLLRDSQRDVEVVSCFDPDMERARAAVQRWEMPDCQVTRDYKEAIDHPGVEWVMIFSPNVYHKEHILYSFEKNKHVFTEKPLATTIEDCCTIHRARQLKPELFFATGFTLRYSPLHRRAKEILSSGCLGRILSINADENIKTRHGGYIMGDWRRHTAIAGPHMLEKCCHDIDLLNFYCESLPSRVAAFGELQYFRPENHCLMEKYPPGTYEFLDIPKECPSPFLADKDLVDTQVGILNYRNAVKVTFQATCANAIPERRMYFSCTEGNLILEVYSMTLRYKAIGDTAETMIVFDGDRSGHGGGDELIMKELYDTMRNGAPVSCSADEGLESAVVALAYQQAIDEERIINLESVWREMGR